MPSTDTPSNSTILASGHFLPRNESETSVPPAPPALPPQLDQTLQSLTSHRSVLGYLLLSRGQPVTLIRHSGVVFEGEHGRKYAQAIGRIVESVQIGLGEVSTDSTGGDDIRFIRIRTKRHEIMISPDERYLLAVLHDPVLQ